MVNDLRRTLHSRGYLITQGFILAAQWLYHMDEKSSAAEPSLYGVPILLLALSLFIMIPGRVGGVVGADTNHAATNFMRLTPLSSGRFVWGLWASTLVHVLAVTLLLAPVLAYRHVQFGTMWELEGVVLGCAAMLSLLVSAAFMYVAGMSTMLRRLINLAVFGYLLMLLGNIGAVLEFYYDGATEVDWAFIWINIGLWSLNGVIALAILLELTRRYYALPAENCSARLRLLTILPLLLALVVQFIPEETIMPLSERLGNQLAGYSDWHTIQMIQLVVACVVALFGALNDALLPSWDLSVRRYQAVPAGLRVLVQPGALSSAVYLALVLVACCGLCCLEKQEWVWNEYMVQIWLSVAISVFFCLLLTDQMTRRSNNNRPVVFIAVAVLSAVIFLILLAMLKDGHGSWSEHYENIWYYCPVAGIGAAADAFFSSELKETSGMDWVRVPQVQVLGCSIFAALLFIAQCVLGSRKTR